MIPAILGGIGLSILGQMVGGKIGHAVGGLLSGDFDPQQAMQEIGGHRAEIIKELMSQGVPFSAASKQVDDEITKYVEEKKQEFESHRGETGQMIGGAIGGLAGGIGGGVIGSAAAAPGRAAMMEGGKKLLGGFAGKSGGMVDRAAQGFNRMMGAKSAPPIVAQAEAAAVKQSAPLAQAEVAAVKPPLSFPNDVGPVDPMMAGLLRNTATPGGDAQSMMILQALRRRMYGGD